MIKTQRLAATLTSLDAALAALLDGLGPVGETFDHIEEAHGRIAARDLTFSGAEPDVDIATTDGYALVARDLVGASSYSPVPLPAEPVWVEAGGHLPDGCDCVLDADLVDRSGAVVQALSEAVPGQGVRRKGQDIPEGSIYIRAGRPLSAFDLFMKRMATCYAIAVRLAHLRVIRIPSDDFAQTAELVALCAREAGALVELEEAAGRDAASIATAIDAQPPRPLLLVGGTGVGRTDAAVEALAARGTVLAHGIALAPGRTTAIGRIGGAPVLALPGAPQDALAAFWVLVRPMIDRLLGREPRREIVLPLARKIASAVGVAEIALLERGDAAWGPIAIGDLSLDHIARADAWLVVPAAVEGYGPGTPVGAHPLRCLA